MPDNYLMPAPLRPARPVHFDYSLLTEAAQQSGVQARDIFAVDRDPSGRLAVTHRDGRVYVVCTPELPDGRGQTGALYDRIRSSKAPNKYDAEKIYFDSAMDWDSPWTVEDLDLEAWRFPEKPQQSTVPAGQDGNGRPRAVQSVLPWVGFDPVRARVAWLWIITQHRVEALTPGQAVHKFPDANGCRRVILESGWLADGEVRRLEEDRTPPALAKRAEVAMVAA